MRLTGITAKVGNTTWELLQIENADWRHVTGDPRAQPPVGHPVYYRVIPIDELECQTCGGSGFDSQGTGYSNVCSDCGGNKVSGPEYEVWPKPSLNVTLIPQWNDSVD